MRPLPYLIAFALGLGAAGLTACGAKENPAMIPADNASELRSHLDDVLSAIDAHDCGDATRAVQQVRSDLESLPSGTSQRLEARLREATGELAGQAADECQATTATTTETQTVETTTIPTTTTDTTITTTPTTETTTTVPTTPTTTPTTPTTPTETTPGDDVGGLETP
ncbi:MAG: hypothetical protein ACJ762_18450 [Solirubrobacteraceae bacterium]